MADAPKGTLTPSTRKARRIGGSKWCSARSYAKACARFVGYHPVACSSASFAILSAPVKVRDGHLGRGVPGRETKRLRGKCMLPTGIPRSPMAPLPSSAQPLGIAPVSHRIISQASLNSVSSLKLRIQAGRGISRFSYVWYAWWGQDRYYFCPVPTPNTDGLPYSDTA
jgi:hypothetical protein